MDRVIFINSAKIWGGGESWLLETALDLKEHVEIIFIANPEGELYPKLLDYRITTLPFKVGNISYLNPIAVFRAYRLLKRMSPKTILFNASKDFKLFAFAGKLAKIRNILYRRDNGRSLRNHILNRFLLRRCVSKFIPCSKFIAEAAFAENTTLFQRDKVEIVYNSINIEAWDVLEVDQIKIDRVGSEMIFGCLGRLSQEKGQLFLPRIARALLDKGISGFKIVIAGIGPLRQELEALIVSERVSEHVILLGFVEQSKSFMASIDCLIIPSYWEGLSTVAMEAMAMSKPIIAFNVAANGEQIEEGETGILIRPFELCDMVDKISEMIHCDRERVFEMGKKGRILLEEKFCKKSANRQLLKTLIN